MVLGHLPTRYGAVEAAVAQHYPNAMRKIRDGVWLVRSLDATTKDVSDKLGFTPDGTNGSGLVTGVNGYFGRWEPDLWEWLNAGKVVGGG